MEQIFKVAIHFDEDNGCIEYNPVTKDVKVVLGNAAKREEIEAYLNKEQVIRVTEKGLRDFIDKKVMPSSSLAVLQVVLTKLWENTGVFVDWSKPIAISG